MAAHPHPSVQHASDIAADHATAILRLFRSGAKITVLVRQPSKPDGSQDFVLTTDTLDEAITAPQLRKTAPTVESTV